MLTPIEIHSKAFKGSGMGYSKADVDGFFHAVSADYETLYAENLSLKEKINNLDESLNHYKEIEKSLQKALVLAETTAEETILSAKKNAIVIEQEAVLKAQTIVADAKVDLEKLKVQLSDLLKQYEVYRAQYKAVAQSQLEMLNSDAFNIGPAIQDDILGLERSATEHVSMLEAVPVSAENNEAAPNKAEQPEEDFDETLSTDESMIKDFSEMFDHEEGKED